MEGVYKWDEALKAYEERKRKAVMDLYYWKQGGDFFTAQLYSLMAKADKDNRFRLSVGFVAESEAYDEWQASPDKAEFFKKYGIPNGA